MARKRRKEATLMTLDQVNEAVGATSYDGGVPHGLYRIFFGGLIPSEASPWLIGAVRAWPTVRDGDYGKNGPQYFISMLRTNTQGRYAAGVYWDIRPREGLRHWSMTDFQNNNGALDQLREEVRVATVSVIKMIDAYTRGDEVLLLPENIRLVPIDVVTGERISEAPRGQKATSEKSDPKEGARDS